jgi:hypothetical protein
MQPVKTQNLSSFCHRCLFCTVMASLGPHGSASMLLRVTAVDIIARARPQLRDEHDSNAVQVDEKAGTVSIKVPLVGTRKAKLKRFVVDAAISQRLV